ncbi:MAG: TldD/PmbA family protein [Coriobacteriia bacterium]|nr:TldD/PmbA family protein [Coriobacteriia bacterium]
MSERFDEARIAELAASTVRATRAEQAEAIVLASSSAYTRFAGNRIHQNVEERDVQVSVRAVLGKRQGVAATNRVDEDGLREACERAVAFARLAPEDEGFPGLPGPEPIERVERFSAATEGFGPEERARAVAGIVAQSAERGLTAAGTVQREVRVVAVANSLGVSTSAPLTDVRATVLSMGTAGGSGWASFTGSDAAGLAPEALGAQAADLASRSEEPGDLAPGRYTVLLAPEAVSTILQFLAYTGFSAKSVEEGSSFMTGRLGERVMSETVTIADDALAPEALGATFDFEGVPKRRTPLVERGVAVAPVTDSYWAARTGRKNTGHALPAPNAFGPYPLNLEMAPGETTEDALLASVDRGVYVTRFHYVNVEDPVKVLLTGMTRDGTFLIEGGALTRPLKNLRFTQGVIEALGEVAGIGDVRQHVGEAGESALVPALLLDGFEFTGQTS